MGPLESIFCWQALLIAITAAGVTQLVKTLIDITWGTQAPDPTPTLAAAKKVGADLRRQTLILNRVVLPMTPIFAGFLFAAIVPMHPENLIEYVTTHNIVWWQAALIYGSWGAACGQFSDYGVSKVKDFLGARTDAKTRRSEPPPAAPTPPVTPPTDVPDPGPPSSR